MSVDLPLLSLLDTQIFSVISNGGLRAVRCQPLPTLPTSQHQDIHNIDLASAVSSYAPFLLVDPVLLGTYVVHQEELPSTYFSTPPSVIIFPSTPSKI